MLKFYWAEVGGIAVYLQNRTSTSGRSWVGDTWGCSTTSPMFMYRRKSVGSWMSKPQNVSWLATETSERVKTLEPKRLESAVMSYSTNWFCGASLRPIQPLVLTPYRESLLTDTTIWTLSRCYARAWRRAGPRGSWTKEKGRRNSASEWSLAQVEKEWTRGRWRPNAQQDILEPKPNTKWWPRRPHQTTMIKPKP